MNTSNKNDYKNMTSGILIKNQIEHAFKNHSLINDYDPVGLQSCSYDMRVGTIYKEGKMLEDYSPVDIEPGEMITIHTLESLKMPNDIAATVFPINSQSSQGFMVLNPGHIDPGYEGVLTVKAINLTKNRLSRMREDQIFTIIFEKLPSETDGYKKNIPDKQTKRNQLKIERDISPENLFKIPSYWKKKGFFAYTENDVKAIVAKYWLGYITLVIALIALLISVLFSGYAVWKDIKTLPQNNSESMANKEVQANLLEITKPKEKIDTIKDNIDKQKDEFIEESSTVKILKEDKFDESNNSDL
jgi:deoxycytidine triphosphate deaminase